MASLENCVAQTEDSRSQRGSERMEDKIKDERGKGGGKWIGRREV